MEFIPLLKLLVRMYRPDVYVEVGLQKDYTFVISRDERVPVCYVTTASFAKKWPKNKKIDLLFINADREYEPVIEDFDMFKSFVTPGTGLVLLYNSALDSDAWRAASLIHRSNKYSDWEIVTLPGSYAEISILRNVG